MPGVVAPDAQENLELAGFGKFLAMTPNDEVNSLAALHFAHVFGRSAVYQLSTVAPPPAAAPAPPKQKRDVAPELRGRPLFGEGHTYAELSARLDAGAVVKKTPLTPEFTATDYAGVHPEAVPLFLLAPGDELIVLTGDLAAEGRPGMTIVSLTPPTPKTATAPSAPAEAATSPSL